jgi:hypothetical protein
VHAGGVYWGCSTGPWAAQSVSGLTPVLPPCKPKTVVCHGVVVMGACRAGGSCASGVNVGNIATGRLTLNLACLSPRSVPLLLWCMCCCCPAGVLTREQYDNCYAEDADIKQRYTDMRDALNKTGRSIQ